MSSAFFTLVVECPVCGELCHLNEETAEVGDTVYCDSCESEFELEELPDVY
jgi:hypothetical protein